MSRSLWLPILISLLVLFCINILMISSVAPDLIGKQLIAWILGVILFCIGKQINLKQLNSYKWPIFIICCVFLLLPIILNSVTRGSSRWIYFAGQTIQPSEFVKPWLMSFLANTNLPILLFIPVTIVMAQPDLGSAISIFFLIIPVILYSKKLLPLAIIFGLIFILISPLIYKYVLHDYQQKRITTFLNPKNDPLGQGYNIIQSQIAVGSGGFFGKGYKKGTQGQLLFLPEKHTDFMFAATAEELGFIGVSMVLVAYFLLISTLFNKAFSTKNRPLFIFTLGIAIQIWMQAFVNIGMNIGLLPVTGVPLPFISVGGSSIMALLFSLGIVYSS